MKVCYLGLGSNLGNRLSYLEKAIEMIKKLPLTQVKKISSIYETEPVGFKPQDYFLNCVVEISTDLSPHELLKKLQEIERLLGRNREKEIRWGPRTIDIDILFYGDLKIDTQDLKIPHPQVFKREFVLKPLREIAPHKVLV